MITRLVPYTMYLQGRETVVSVPDPQIAAELQCAYLKGYLKIPYSLTVVDGRYIVKSPKTVTIIFQKENI